MASKVNVKDRIGNKGEGVGIFFKQEDINNNNDNNNDIEKDIDINKDKDIKIDIDIDNKKDIKKYIKPKVKPPVGYHCRLPEEYVKGIDKAKKITGFYKDELATMAYDLLFKELGIIIKNSGK